MEEDDSNVLRRGGLMTRAVSRSRSRDGGESKREMSKSPKLARKKSAPLAKAPVKAAPKSMSKSPIFKSPMPAKKMSAKSSNVMQVGLNSQEILRLIVFETNFRNRHSFCRRCPAAIWPSSKCTCLCNNKHICPRHMVATWPKSKIR